MASDLSMDAHVARVCSQSFYMLRNFDESDDSWTRTLLRRLSTPIIKTHVDYYNSLLARSPN